MLNGQCSMVNAQCSMVNAQWSMVNAQWSMINAQWSMINAQWSMINTPTATLPPVAAPHSYQSPASDSYLPSLREGLGVGSPITHMQPARPILLYTLKEQLIELQVFLDITEHLTAHLDVRDVDVGSLAQPVLRILHAAHGFIQSVTAVPTGDPDHTEALP